MSVLAASFMDLVLDVMVTQPEGKFASPGFTHGSATLAMCYAEGGKLGKHRSEHHRMGIDFAPFVLGGCGVASHSAMAVLQQLVGLAAAAQSRPEGGVQHNAMRRQSNRARQLLRETLRELSAALVKHAYAVTAGALRNSAAKATGVLGATAVGASSAASAASSEEA